ncbi:cobW-domain-containing protein [Ceratobasidium sp. AG-I]|nr:cobW-domain-containing protein [Ceratobasidium sp. AG-I]
MTFTEPKSAIPITVFTGFLGAGKTTIILSLLPKLPKDYKVVLLKNEFGDVEVDSQLASNSSLTAVSEILNGCMCCVLVGQMKTALLEIRDQYRPDRIIIESSGSAFPATLAFQIRELERETKGDFKLDAIVTVVDAENFSGYEDTSPTAKMQAQYTDVILVNKWELVSERDLDIVIDHLSTLNDLTPKLRCEGKSGVPPNLIFGLDSKQFLEAPGADTANGDHHSEVETVTLCRGTADFVPHKHTEEHTHTHTHASEEHGSTAEPLVTPELLSEALDGLPKDSVYRVKGFVSFQNSVAREVSVLNWAFGRFELVPLIQSAPNSAAERMKPGDILLTVMGAVGEVKRYGIRIGQKLGARLI